MSEKGTRRETHLIRKCLSLLPSERIEEVQLYSGGLSLVVSSVINVKTCCTVVKKKENRLNLKEYIVRNVRL